MKVSSRTLKLMAAAGALTVAGGTWHAAEQAVAYEQKRSEIVDGATPPEKEPVIVKLGNRLMDAWYWVGTKTGLIRPRPYPCGPCGMG